MGHRFFHPYPKICIMLNIQILEVRSELGAGTRGASLGVGAIKVASLNAESKYFGSHPLIPIPNENEKVFQGSSTKFAKHIHSIVKIYENMVDTIAEISERPEEQFLVILAGDHSTAGATIAGLRHAYPEKKLGVVWIDAHADLHTPYTTPSGNVHGMPLAASLGLDNLDQQRNEITSEEAVLWNRLKYAGNITPKIEPHELVFVAVRDTEPEEDYLLQQLKIKNFTVSEVRKRGPKAIAKDILQRLGHCDLIYISFDVDSMDSILISKGTGTPVENGLTEEQASLLINELVQDPRTCCLEITEVNPTLDDKCNKMAETAFRILERASETVKKRDQKRDQKKGKAGAR
jgi:arginase